MLVNFDKLYEVLKISKKIFQELDIKWCLTWGSLLGAVRDNDFIMFDNGDLDIFLIETPTEQYRQALDYYKKRGFKIKSTSIPSRVARGWESIEICRIGYAQRNKDGYYYFQNFPFHTRFFKSLNTVKIKETECPVPNYTNEILEMIYGPTWRIPQMMHLPREKMLERLLEKKKKGL